MNIPAMNIYGPLALIGFLLTAFVWTRMQRRNDRAPDARLTVIYFAAIAGAIIGAKVSFLLAEGWAYREDWVALLSGRSVTGALLGGYVAVELAKWKLRYRYATGDLFAIIAPLGLALGRVGCILQGCCPGRTLSLSFGGSTLAFVWPAAWAELGFNLVFLTWALIAARRDWAPGNRFHVYLIAYGVFRLLHESLRDTARLVEWLSGYQLIAVLIVIAGAWRFLQRRQERDRERLSRISVG